MVNTIFLVSVLVLVPFFQIRFNANALSTTITSFSSYPWKASSFNRRYSLASNTDIKSLLMSGSNSGTQPTLVAIPLYIRNNLSKYPSIYELLSSSLQQNDSKSAKKFEIQPNVSDGNISVKKLINEKTKQNDFTSTQPYRTQTQKSMKYNIREEQQKAVRQRNQHKYDSELKDSVEFSSPPKPQWSSYLTNTPNRYSQSNERTYSRPSQKFLIEEERKQSSPQFESVSNTFSTNKFNDVPNTEQKEDDNSDYGSVDAIKINSEISNKYNNQNYLPFDSSEGKVVLKNRGSEKSTYNSPQTSSYGSELSEENPNSRYSDSGNRNDNYLLKNERIYQNQDNNEYEIANKNNEFQYRSHPSIRSYERPIDSSQYSTALNTFISRPNSLRQSYETSNGFVTTKPSTSSSFTSISSEEDSSQPSNNYNNNFRALSSSNGYNSQTNPSNTQINGYAVNPSVYSSESHSVSPNNNYVKTESKSQFTSISNPNYSSDYSTLEDNDCYDDNSNDYKSTHSSQSIKSQNIRPEVDIKDNERDSYETEDLDPSKLDLKIVHLPVSLLRRLIGSGDISLPSYQ